MISWYMKTLSYDYCTQEYSIKDLFKRLLTYVITLLSSMIIFVGLVAASIFILPKIIAYQLLLTTLQFIFQLAGLIVMFIGVNLVLVSWAAFIFHDLRKEFKK